MMIQFDEIEWLTPVDDETADPTLVRLLESSELTPDVLGVLIDRPEYRVMGP